MGKVLVTGNFNILHPGHIRLLKFAKNFGTELIVGVFNNDLAIGATDVDELFRLESVSALSFIDKALLIDTSLEDFILRIKPDVIVKGREYENQINIEHEILSQIGGHLVFSSGEMTISSNYRKANLPQLPSAVRIKIETFMRHHNIKASRLKELISAFENKRVCVIGDTIVDEYIDCMTLGLSQEEPTIVVSPREKNKFIGGAAIVAAHAAQLGANVNLLSVAGEDEETKFVRSTLDKFGVNHQLSLDMMRPTTLKQRFRTDGKSLLRVSTLSQQAIPKNTQAEIVSRFTKEVENTDLLIFSDFNYGCLPTTLVDNLTSIAKKHGIFIVADSQTSSQLGDISRFKSVDLLTPTELEARSALKNYDDGLVVLAQKLMENSGAKQILLKLGSEGLIAQYAQVKNSSIKTEQLPSFNPNPVDVSGAGDSVLTAAALALISGSTLWEAALLGSAAAFTQISRLGNQPITKSELEASLP